MSAEAQQDPTIVDVVVVGGGPAGLSAALVLGRACKRVLLCDAGRPRNASAQQIHGFVTQDGTAPMTFRRIAGEQLRAYPAVDVRGEAVRTISGHRGRFEVVTDSQTTLARRVILSVGLIDDLPALPGYRELWGQSIFQCPYCHGWEVRGGALGLLAPTPQLLEWSPFLLGWSRDLVVFTDGQFTPQAALRQRLAQIGISIEERPIRRLITAAAPQSPQPQLSAIELADGTQVARSVLFARPPQRQHALVHSLGLALDEHGFVRVDDQRQTTCPGIYAAGDLTTLFQGALLAASAGAQAAYALNHELTIEQFGVSGTAH